MTTSSETLAKPRLKRSDTPRHWPGIIHIGPGAFFRAFNATYTVEALEAKGGDWGIRAVSLRTATIRDKLAPQDYAYTSVSLTPEGAINKVIGVIDDILVASEDLDAVLTAMSQPEIHIVSLTVTEKGYCHNPATGELNLDSPTIAQDLKHPDQARSAPAILVYALARRHAAGLKPFTILSCDNLPNNGELTKRVVLDFAQAVDPDLAEWIETECRFPSTMVDRITPATTGADIAKLAEKAGYVDQGCVVHEPFRQWVIEDDFVDGKRPDWDVAGAQFVSDVAAFENMKLRCLNGTHSTLAYLGYLSGYETIAETVADPVFAELIDKVWMQEIVPTVPQPEGEDLEAYCAALKARYLNPAIRHRTWQIAMDGSQKLPQRLLGTMTENLAAGRNIPLLALAVAGWMRYVSGIDEKGQPIDVKDPLAETLRAASDGAETSEEKVDALLAISAVFEPELSANTNFRNAVVATYEALIKYGAREASKQAIQGA